jgi:hypothetical protein
MATLGRQTEVGGLHAAQAAGPDHEIIMLMTRPTFSETAEFLLHLFHGFLNTETMQVYRVFRVVRTEERERRGLRG